MPTGWCPGTRSVADMLAMYPRTSAVRIFFGPGDGLPASAWTDPRQKLSQVPADADVIVSHKDQGVDAGAFVSAWEATGRTGRLILVPHHEPEQQEGGDPTRAEFRASWTRTRQQVGDHPARHDGRLLLAVCYTLQWVRRGGDWRMWWPEHEADAVDLVLGDWYQYTPGEPNPYRPRTYEDPTAALTVLTDISTAVGKPWGIAEIDHLRITRANGFTVDLDPDGTLCADWYRRMHAEAKRLGCQVWCQFHRNHGDLTDRLPERQALRDLIAQEDTVSRLLWLPQVLRDAGLTVHEVDGWETRGSSTYDPKGIICHATAGSATSTDAGEIGVLLNGSNTAPPPIAQLYLSRTGAFHVVASGKCYHALTGWGGPLKGYGNTNLIGIEAQNDNRGQEWPQAQLDAYQRGVAAICKRMDWNAQENVAAHREHQPYPPPSWTTSSKSDPHGIDMGTFRARVTALINGEDDDMTPAQFAALLDDPAVARRMRALAVSYSGGGIPAGMTVLAVLNELLTRARAADGTDEQAIIAGVLAGLSPEKIAAAIPAEIAGQVADELAARLAS